MKQQRWVIKFDPDTGPSAGRFLRKARGVRSYKAVKNAERATRCRTRQEALDVMFCCGVSAAEPHQLP
jgi:hypothetical protein